MVLCLCCSHVFATTSVKGFINDANGSPIPGISVYLKSSYKGSSTNGSGYFIIENIDPGSYTIVCSGIGWLTIEKSLDLTEGQSFELNVSLEESVSTLDEVVVMSGGITGLKDIPGSVQYISPKELDKFSYTDINRALRTIPGVNMPEMFCMVMGSEC